MLHKYKAADFLGTAFREALRSLDQVLGPGAAGHETQETGPMDQWLNPTDS